jgi:hypothetical protein
MKIDQFGYCCGNICFLQYFCDNSILQVKTGFCILVVNSVVPDTTLLSFHRNVSGI